MLIDKQKWLKTRLINDESWVPAPISHMNYQDVIPFNLTQLFHNIEINPMFTHLKTTLRKMAEIIEQNKVFG